MAGCMPLVVCALVGLDHHAAAMRDHALFGVNMQSGGYVCVRDRARV